MQQIGSRPQLTSALAVAACLVLGPSGCAPEQPVANTRIPEAAPSVDTAHTSRPAEAEGPVDFPALPRGAGEIDSDAPSEFTLTKTGLKYRVLRQGTGKKPTVLNRVVAKYHGWTDDGKVFDSTYKGGKPPATFKLNQVVEGWREGIPYVAEGGMIELVIPPGLGYGSQAIPGIPPNSTLHFLVELEQVR
ncbi:MAG: FKBP-type peptidyl-prolyl cis-trans isomerase [Planctomycetaceae bacterium]|nr:MAG: FKBP-type peptidyl-prolyl cis-trans isomerase [Planctomycetaceae bacterium]